MSNAPHHDLYAPRWISEDQTPKNLFNEILPGLFMGGTADDGTIDFPTELQGLNDENPFDAVVTLYSWAQPMGWGVEELRYGFADAEVEHFDVNKLLATARWAHSRWVDGDRVLIRCQAGLNRSGLVTALTLMLIGYQAVEAIALIRANRAEVALFNNAFVDWLVSVAPQLLGSLSSESAA